MDNVSKILQIRSNPKHRKDSLRFDFESIYLITEQFAGYSQVDWFACFNHAGTLGEKYLSIGKRVDKVESRVATLRVCIILFSFFYIFPD